ncbi:hypothetical protein [Leptospira vanthielii]|uniref:Uncharacterized protein n=1 Tax=Leptospira vanthielii serovar Holland str. Waz Holland = ATCC 700522 TaxID=1218591 RepID=N1W3I0_9LEPT|nr:hypothetical protein [Leptospira vanthielii]EMY67787.1 hypothetical protein LEP1GSC199_0658 [Leptospira vanthielii serovar Holland str. Waz Holland = ATCC 700522]
MKKYSLEISEDEAVVLFEFFSRYSETNTLAFKNPAEYISFQRLSGQIDRTTSAMFKPNYEEILLNAQNRISNGFEGFYSVGNFPISVIYSMVSGYFWPELLEENGLIVLKSEYSRIKEIPDEPIEAECLINHIHILDLFSHSAGLKDEPFWDSNHPDFKDAWNLAKLISEMWKHKLSIDFPDYIFRIYVTKYDNPIIRFHKVRENHKNWLEEGNIDMRNLKGKNSIITVE